MVIIMTRRWRLTFFFFLPLRLLPGKRRTHRVCMCWWPAHTHTHTRLLRRLYLFPYLFEVVAVQWRFTFTQILPSPSQLTCTLIRNWRITKKLKHRISLRFYVQDKKKKKKKTKSFLHRHRCVLHLSRPWCSHPITSHPTVFIKFTTDDGRGAKIEARKRVEEKRKKKVMPARTESNPSSPPDGWRNSRLPRSVLLALVPHTLMSLADLRVAALVQAFKNEKKGGQSCYFPSRLKWPLPHKHTADSPLAFLLECVDVARAWLSIIASAPTAPPPTIAKRASSSASPSNAIRRPFHVKKKKKKKV